MNWYDTNNWARIKFETESTGLPLRTCFMQVFHDPLSFFFFDGKNAKARRQADYPGYKSKRLPAPDNFYMMLGAFKELLTHTHHVIIDVPGYEADDVIATLVSRYREQKVEIISTDRDFCALHRLGVTTPSANLKGIEPTEVRLYKTLCGDKSDSIDGIVGFGPGKWAKLTTEHKKNWVACLNGSEPKDLGTTKKFDLDLLRVYWKIIGFYDVPYDLITANTRVGISNYSRGDSILKELLQ